MNKVFEAVIKNLGVQIIYTGIIVSVIFPILYRVIGIPVKTGIFSTIIIVVETVLIRSGLIGLFIAIKNGRRMRLCAVISTLVSLSLSFIVYGGI